MIAPATTMAPPRMRGAMLRCGGPKECGTTGVAATMSVDEVIAELPGGGKIGSFEMRLTDDETLSNVPVTLANWPVSANALFGRFSVRPLICSSTSARTFCRSAWNAPETSAPTSRGPTRYHDPSR